MRTAQLRCAFTLTAKLPYWAPLAHSRRHEPQPPVVAGGCAFHAPHLYWADFGPLQQEGPSMFQLYL